MQVEDTRLRNRKLGLGAAALLVLMGLVIGSQTWVLKEVTIVDGTQAARQVVFRGSVGTALSQVGVQLAPGDEVLPGPGAPVRDDLVITVDRAFAVELQVDGEYRVLPTVSETVGELLAEAGVELGELDRVEPGLGSALLPDTKIRVVRVREETVTETESIPYETWRWAEPEWEQGTVDLWREGREGEQELIVKWTYEDGEPVDRTVVETRVVQEPRAEIIGIGTKVVVRSMNTPAGTIQYTDVMDMVATAYYPGPESTGLFADGYTATGMRAGFGVVAVDPRVIPLGTRLYIPGYGIAVAADVGAAIQGNTIDLCFDTYREALHFGRRNVQVYILASD